MADLPLYRMDDTGALVRAARVLEAHPGKVAGDAGDLELENPAGSPIRRKYLAKFVGMGLEPVGMFYVEAQDGQISLVADEDFDATEVEKADLVKAEDEWAANQPAARRAAAATQEQEQPAEQPQAKAPTKPQGKPAAAQGSQGAPTDKGAPEQPPPNKPAPEAKT